ncbi:MAG: division/cell wall cluster transcriptional repressor MraZ [Planctomycetia bacterium]|jgi:MraZ protein
MNGVLEFITGEHKRTLDDRYRLSIPAEMCDVLMNAPGGESTRCMLTKERVGCLGLWNADAWESKLAADVELVKSKMAAGKFHDQVGQVQLLGRLLSTRDTAVNLSGRGRLSIPESFRPFLGVEPNEEVMVVGAGVSIEIWKPSAWLDYVEQQMPEFRTLLSELSG